MIYNEPYTREKTTPRSSRSVDHAMITNNPTLPGFGITRSLGLVRGITVRSRSIVGSFGALCYDTAVIVQPE